MHEGKNTVNPGKQFKFNVRSGTKHIPVFYSELALQVSKTVATPNLKKKKSLVTACLVAPSVKNPSAMQETWIWSLGWKDPLEEGMTIHSSILAWRIPMDRGAWWATAHGVAKSQTRLSEHTTATLQCKLISINLFYLYNSIIIKYQRTGPQRFSRNATIQQSAFQSVPGLLGSQNREQWPYSLWFAHGVSPVCLHFELKGSGCGFLAFVILFNTLNLLDSAEEGRAERELLLLFWCFQLFGPWGVIGREEACDMQ